MSVSVPRAECRSDSSIVMICFSPDDTFLLSSAIDNELRQYTTVDGRLCLKIDSARTGCLENYTRSYYMNGGDVIISGSSEEKVVRMYSAYTGDLMHVVQLYPERKHSSLYVQSLRGDPHTDFGFSVLVNYRCVGLYGAAVLCAHARVCMCVVTEG